MNKIERTFQDIPEGKVQDADKQPFLVSLGWSKGSTWLDLLKSKRILIVSEAGTGKTFECRNQAEQLWAVGEPAFFLELAALATDDPRCLLDEEEEARLDTWLASQSEVATFFLDSIDELKLTTGSFERALKRLKKCLGNRLHRSRIVITTRPIPFDELLVRKILPVPQSQLTDANEEIFTKIAMREQQNPYNENTERKAKDWRSVALMPLSDEQIMQFSRLQGIDDSEQLLKDVQRRNAEEFARRPQDLIELCCDWREHKRIRNHRDQIATNIRVKLLPREDRLERADLSNNKAFEGASRLALAIQMTRRLTIRHNAESDTAEGDSALDPAIILSDWSQSERKALLERSLFGFASYGRVRFHHRSVAEFLAAERLVHLRQQGMSFKALKRILFAKTNNQTIARPSKRPLAAWVALKDIAIFELLRDNEPSVLLDEGDPASLSFIQRRQALRAYVGRYGQSGWTGNTVPNIQVYRFASDELAGDINELWSKGIVNPDVNELLLNLIESGRMKKCADLAFIVTQNSLAPANERIAALNALVAVDDNRLEKIAVDIANADAIWPNEPASEAILSLFPNHISINQICQAFRWIKSKERTPGNFSWYLPRLIETSKFELNDLEHLRDCLVDLISEKLEWQNETQHIKSSRSHLCGALAATCVRGLAGKHSVKWLHAACLSLLVHPSNRFDDEPFKSLLEFLYNLDSNANEQLFWIEDTFLQSFNGTKSPWQRLANIVFHDGPVQLNSDRDLVWISDSLGQTIREKDERAMLLEAALRLSPKEISNKIHATTLRNLVADDSSLIETLDKWLAPSSHDKQHRRWEKKNAERQKQEGHRKAKQKDNLILFWREIADQPEKAFSSEKAWGTAWNLWEVMRNDDNANNFSGWNPRFIEEHFNLETVERLRAVLKRIWRDDTPTLPSERKEDERNTYLKRWQMGLAALYAEAEGQDWASKLNNSEAELASRYAIIELNGLPQWLEDVTSKHQSAIDSILGNELSWELKQPAEVHSSLLQGLGNTSKNVAKLFIPRVKNWLENDYPTIDIENVAKVSERIRLVTDVILKHGHSIEVERIQKIAIKKLEQKMLFAENLIWLSILMRTDPTMGVEKLAFQLKAIIPKERSEAVTWFANLFGGRRSSVSLTDKRFTADCLLRLLRLAYSHVKISDDVYHEGSYSPDVRDDAEQARNNIVSALLNYDGVDGLAAKFKMAADPLCAHFKHRIIALASEHWAQEIDSDVYDEIQLANIERKGEAPAATNEAMFTVMKDRLSDINELLLSDISPREAWSGISEERVMRREIARQLSYASNSIYTVDQEAVTADEKETDIRLRSAFSKHEAVIELKLGDNRSFTDLKNTIENQLVKKYMAAENSKAGTLLVTLAKDRKWKHPDEKRFMKPEEMVTLLQQEAKTVQEMIGNGIYIAVHFLDLRPRLSIESAANP